MKYYKIIDNKEVFFKGNVLYTEQGTIINPTEEQMINAGWQVYVQPEPTDAQKLAAAKAEKIAQIEYYDSSDNVSMVLLCGLVMNSDNKSEPVLKHTNLLVLKL